MPDEEKEELYDQEPDLEEDFDDKDWPFAGKGGLDDVPMPTGAACVELSNILGRASEHSGDFSFGGQAEHLPPIPGIFVDGVGPIPVPLWEERAHKLIEKCEKSPFGHNYDTKLDENVRKSWQLSPDQMQFKHPQWQIGIEKMTTSIADQLGYQDIPLQCKLYKLLLYEEGGHFVKHQDTEKEDGMVATLVIQPPSLHEGGDLVVYANGKVKCRHDFGKSDGTATYLPHYAVHYADAEHAVETATKGYRLVLVYSVCLPSKICHLERYPNKPMARELGRVIETMGDDDNCFALLLSHEYSEKSVKRRGSGAFKGVDRARFLALEEANASVSDEKKLLFRIADLYHHVYFYGRFGRIGDWNEKSRDEKVKWYTTDGSCMPVDEKMPVKFNFLNPVHETNSQLWKKPFGSSDMHGYLGNEGPTKNSSYRRYAIIAWPVRNEAEYIARFVNLEQAFDILEDPDTPTLRKVMDIGAVKMMEAYEIVTELKQRDLWHYPTNELPVSVTPHLCQTLCQFLENSGDPALVNLFFRVFFKHLQRKASVVEHVSRMVDKYDWKDIGQELLGAFSENNVYIKEDAAYFLEAVLGIAEALSVGDAKTMMLQLAVEKLDEPVLSSSQLHEYLFKLVLQNEEDSTWEALSNKFKSMKPRLLESTATFLTKQLKDTRLPDVKKAILISIVSSRRDWLASQIRVLDKPFTWEMPVAEFPDNSDVEAFLKGPDKTMSTEGADMYTYRQNPRHQSASFGMETSTCGNFVLISKNRNWYDETLQKLPLMKKEFGELQNATTEVLVAVVSGSEWRNLSDVNAQKS